MISSGLLIVIMLLFLLLLTPAGKLTGKLEQITAKRDTEIRVYYVDKFGNLRFNRQKHYAMLIKTLEDGKVVLESYLDDKGEPAKQPKGFCSIRHSYDFNGNDVLIEYLDEQDQLVDITDGYAIIKRSYTKKKKVKSEYYFDHAAYPAAKKDGTYGCTYERDEKGRVTKITYLDMDREPAACNKGYAIVQREYNDKGKITKEHYYDADGDPTTAESGQYGYIKDYDDLGREIQLTYIDSEEKPIDTTKGYASVIRTYSSDESDDYKAMYYDSAGNPARMKGGYYGTAKIQGKTWYLNHNGERMYRLDKLLSAHPYVVVIIGTIAAAGVSLLPEKYKRIKFLFALLYMLFILYMTLFVRESGENRLEWRLFHAYRIFFTNSGRRREILYNILLFVPFGAAIYKKGSRRWIRIILLTIFIEATQYFFGLGYCEADDILNNSLGGMAGYLYSASAQAAYDRKQALK